MRSSTPSPFSRSLRPLLLALLSTSLVTACDAGLDATADDVPVRVSSVGLDTHDMPVLLLEERGGSRWLPIWIGSAEARSIAQQIESLTSPRPNAHDLAQRVIAGLHGEVERVVVTDLRAGTYYATITLRTADRRIVIDSRPSDAVAIALRTGSPIFVRERLFVEPEAEVRDARDRSSSI